MGQRCNPLLCFFQSPFHTLIIDVNVRFKICPKGRNYTFADQVRLFADLPLFVEPCRRLLVVCEYWTQKTRLEVGLINTTWRGWCNCGNPYPNPSMGLRFGVPCPTPSMALRLSGCIVTKILKHLKHLDRISDAFLVINSILSDTLSSA